MTATTPLATTPRLTLMQIQDAVTFFTDRLTAGNGEKFGNKLYALLNDQRPRELIVGDHRPQGVLVDALQAAGINHMQPGVLGGPCRLTFEDDGYGFITDEYPEKFPASEAPADEDDALARFVKAGMEAQRAVDDALRKALVGTNITPNPVNLARALQLAQQVREIELECDRRQTELNQLRGQLMIRRREAAAAFVDPQPHLFDPLPPASTDGTGTHNPPEPVSEATPAPLKPDAGGDAPAKLIPGHLYELRELANLTDESLEAGLAKPPRQLRPFDKRDGSPGDGGQIGQVLGIAGGYYAVIQCGMTRTQKTYMLQPCIPLTEWYAANPGGVPDTWQQRRDANDNVAPEEVPLEGVSVYDDNKMTWVLLDDIDQVEILVPIEKKAPAPPPPASVPPSFIDWVALMKACKTADEGRELFTKHTEAIAQLQQSIGVTPTFHRVGGTSVMARGFETVDKKEWKSAIAAARAKNPTAAEHLERLIEQGREIHGKLWEKLYEGEMTHFHKTGRFQDEDVKREKTKTPEQPAGQSMKWGPWKGSLLSALHKFHVDVADVLPIGEALELYMSGKKPSVAAQQYVASLGKAGKALDKIEHTTSSATAIAAGNGSAKKGAAHGRRR